MLFHIVPRPAWEAALRAGVYAPPSLASEGFVHLSTEAQWPLTAARFFRGQNDLLLLTIDETRLRAEVRFEAADGDAFPHLYGALDPGCVDGVRALGVDPEGAVRLGPPAEGPGSLTGATVRRA